MVLEHVADGAGLLVERAAVLDADRLGDRDLHVVDVAPVPERLEDPVAEPEDEQVPDGLLPEVMVDPVDLRLAEDPEHLAVEPLRRLEVAAERLLDDDPPPAAVVLLVVQPAPPELADDLREGRRLGRQVEQQVGARLVLEVHLLEALRQRVERRVVAEVAAVVRDPLEELALDLRLQLDAAVRVERPRDVLAERRVVVRPPPDREERPSRRAGGSSARAARAPGRSCDGTGRRSPRTGRRRAGSGTFSRRRPSRSRFVSCRPTGGGACRRARAAPRGSAARPGALRRSAGRPWEP